jgi:hypothetical protein
MLQAGKGQRTVFDMMASVQSKASGKMDQETVSRDFIVWLALDLLPFSAVNSPGLQYFFRRHVPHIHIPDESTLRKKYLCEIYDTLADAVIELSLQT